MLKNSRAGTRFTMRHILIMLLLATGLQPALAIPFEIVTPRVKVCIVYAPDGGKLDSISAYLLANDIRLVSGYLPKVYTHISKAGGNVIIIGPIQSKLIKGLPLGFNQLQGKWECYNLSVVINPARNIKKTLVIAGSDARGGAYGVFAVSEKIGVSPWYWWVDVNPAQKTNLSIDIVSFTSARHAGKIH